MQARRIIGDILVFLAVAFTAYLSVIMLRRISAVVLKDTYVQMFCLEQLRWCGLPCQAEKIRAFADVTADKAVKDFADWVARELAK